MYKNIQFASYIQEQTRLAYPSTTKQEESVCQLDEVFRVEHVVEQPEKTVIASQTFDILLPHFVLSLMQI